MASPPPEPQPLPHPIIRNDSGLSLSPGPALTVLLPGGRSLDLASLSDARGLVTSLDTAGLHDLVFLLRDRIASDARTSRTVRRRSSLSHSPTTSRRLSVTADGAARAETRMLQEQLDVAHTTAMERDRTIATLTAQLQVT